MMRAAVFAGATLVILAKLPGPLAAPLLVVAAWICWGGRLYYEPSSNDVYGRALMRQRIRRFSPENNKGGKFSDYMNRWHLLPHNPCVNLYLHVWLASDQNDAYHDHPAASVSILLRGTLHEVTPCWTPDGSINEVRKRKVPPFKPVFRGACHQHRIEVPAQSRPPLTLFLMLPRYRPWFFWCVKTGQQMTKTEYHQNNGCP